MSRKALSIAEILAQKQEAHEARLMPPTPPPGQPPQMPGKQVAQQMGWAHVADPQLALGQLHMPQGFAQARLDQGAQPSMPSLPPAFPPQPAPTPVPGLPGTSNEQVFSGTVKWYRPDRGFGVLVSPEAFQVVGENVPFLRSELNGVIPNEGDTCQFCLGKNKNQISGGGKFKNSFKAVKIVFTNSQAAVNRDLQVQAMVGKVFPGTINSYDDHQGFGFIYCDALWQGASVGFKRYDIRDPVHMYVKGAPCYFTFAVGPKGENATDVHVGLLSQGPVGGVPPPAGGSSSSVDQGSGAAPIIDSSGGGSGPIRKRRSGWDQRDAPY